MVPLIRIGADTPASHGVAPMMEIYRTSFLTIGFADAPAEKTGEPLSAVNPNVPWKSNYWGGEYVRVIVGMPRNRLRSASARQRTLFP